MPFQKFVQIDRVAVIQDGPFSGKIAAIGFALKRWVTMHGMSFNVEVGLDGFNLIVGCGLVGQPVSSLVSAGEPARPRGPPLSRALSGTQGRKTRTSQNHSISMGSLRILGSPRILPRFHYHAFPRISRESTWDS